MSASIKSSPSKSNGIKNEDNGNNILSDRSKDIKEKVNNGNNINDNESIIGNNTSTDGVDEAENSILSDPEDYLEENESLDMNLTKGNSNIWLVKLPKYLAERWAQEGNLNGARLGTVKIKKNSANTNNKLQVKLVLNENVPNEPKIPQEYDISILNTQVRNSYVFTEENLKKFKQELTEVAELPEQPQPKVDDKQNKNGKFQPRRKFKFFRVQKNGENGPIRKYIPFVKTIPKKTALIGKIVHDCQIIPSKADSQYNKVLMDRKNIVKGPERPKVTLLNEIPGVIQSNAGPSIKGNNTSVFLKSNPNARKNAEGRAIRMPKKDLLDLLFRLFEEYEYWSMKGLKERTRQPESYLKESLESIANLIKKGPYTSKYNLKPEFRRLRDAERTVRLGLDVTGADDNKDKEDEDEDLEMEDVV
ncbi:RNA polymerase II transcription initiation factor TFIIF middle subunit [Scheffersomyces amazonensis]|uniref:RNA polymerase II transcription initiation factor TFIIF middle subunit n=1 Tax=Scheffersomyces amazonensis TaxID=1078765 RepID=UPI00315D8791